MAIIMGASIGKYNETFYKVCDDKIYSTFQNYDVFGYFHVLQLIIHSIRLPSELANTVCEKCTPLIHNKLKTRPIVQSIMYTLLKLLQLNAH